MERKQPSDPLVFHLDREDTIVHVNEAWDRFACANGAPFLTAAAVVGHSLWDHVTGDEVRHLTEVLLTRARAGQPIKRLPFRCDSPALRRYMQMDMWPLPGGGIGVESVEVHVDLRTPNPLLRSDPFSEGAPLRMCAWCRRVDVGDGRWVEAEQAVVILQLFTVAHPPPISHTICPDDLRRLGWRQARKPPAPC